METESNNIEEQIQSLMQEYGRLGFLNLALDKQKVTRQIINVAKFKHFWGSSFFYLVSLTIIATGLTGYTKFAPLEVLFLAPIGIVIFWAVQSHSRKVKKALHEVSKLATGIHAEKLERNQL